MEYITELNKILKKKSITTLFQPIICLKTGEILGYEALSRGPVDSPLFSPEKLFSEAKKCNKLWEIEALCRKKALEIFKRLQVDKYLFLNVDPIVLKDRRFKEEFMSSTNVPITFEITEKNCINDFEDFKNILDSYVSHGYKIALDDMGSGYSTLIALSKIKPHFVKIDMELIRDIDKDTFKQAVVKALVLLSENTNMKLIAEGIETEQELEALINLNVYAGQGFFLQRPTESIFPVPKNIRAKIFKSKLTDKYSIYTENHFVGQILHNITSFSESVSCKLLQDYFSLAKISGACIVDGENKPVGLIMEHSLNSKLATQYGNAVFGKRPISIIMDENPLIVDFFTPISKVSKFAMNRGEDTLYDFIIITKENKYAGIVTIKTLLEYTTALERNYAKELNPLTGLPGNTLIFKTLSNIISSHKEFCILYFDLNNFKTYNDTYGFENGDKILKFTSTLIEDVTNACFPLNSFIGHIGGDDFVTVFEGSYKNSSKLCNLVIERFDNEVLQFFNDTDKANGYIFAQDRNGRKDKFPLTSISISGMHGNFKSFPSPADISKHISSIKKQVKLKHKSAYIIEDLHLSLKYFEHT